MKRIFRIAIERDFLEDFAVYELAQVDAIALQQRGRTMIMVFSLLETRSCPARESPLVGWFVC